MMYPYYVMFCKMRTNHLKGSKWGRPLLIRCTPIQGGGGVLRDVCVHTACLDSARVLFVRSHRRKMCAAADLPNDATTQAP